MVVNATPLIALDGLALDTETTSLDIRKAEIVEVGLVPLAEGRLKTEATERYLVRPRASIPLAATRIHGISNATVSGAPQFVDVWAAISPRLTTTILIGHSIGYDLAVLQRECERAGIAWHPPATLDVRVLAEAVAPRLPNYALESLAAWLEVELGDRHTACGDALTAGRIFLALLPHMRERGIRTLAEAKRVSAELSSAREIREQRNWAVLAAPPPSQSESGLPEKLDAYPYRYRIRDVMTTPASFIAADVPLGQVIRRMSEGRVSSLYVNFDATARTAETTGIVTERDAMRCIADAGPDGLRTPVREIARRPLLTIPDDAFMFVAIARMSRLNIRHLGVVDGSGTVVGALSARDLLRFRASGSIALGDEIFTSEDIPSLARAWAKLPSVVASLSREGLSGLEVAALISHQLVALSAKAALLAETRLEAAGYGKAPCPYVFCVLGSAGRGESLLAMDQDNALIYADGGDTEACERWFSAFATQATGILNEVGVPYCSGGIMASNAAWRGTVSAWRERIAGWIRRSTPEDLLAVDIFFDMRGAHGDLRMSESLWREVFGAARGQAAFAKLLAASVADVPNALSFFGRIRTSNGRLDLKKAGLFGIVTTVRALAILHHVVEHGTQPRIAGLLAREIGGNDIENLAAAQKVFVDLLVAQQIEDIERGIPPSNTVEVKRLSRREQQELHGALKSVSHLQQLLRDHLFNH